ncbi:hypothetical protein MG293_011283 [Ovis ammon polii]|uniref:Uncharacterized protein n=1 Tax=Ovis ammon polii TaxID=230172 RepID=A0AAD4U4F8_OVIAM|nr:hypothetical protein MG293_011283 [Ovis ammon polii]
MSEALCLASLPAARRSAVSTGLRGCLEEQALRGHTFGNGLADKGFDRSPPADAPRLTLPHFAAAEVPELVGSGGAPPAPEPIKHPEVVWPQEQSGDHRAALDGLTALIGARQPSRAPGPSVKHSEPRVAPGAAWARDLSGIRALPQVRMIARTRYQQQLSGRKTQCVQLSREEAGRGSHEDPPGSRALSVLEGVANPPLPTVDLGRIWKGKTVEPAPTPTQLTSNMHSAHERFTRHRCPKYLVATDSSNEAEDASCARLPESHSRNTFPGVLQPPHNGL